MVAGRCVSGRGLRACGGSALPHAQEPVPIYFPLRPFDLRDRLGLFQWLTGAPPISYTRMRRALDHLSGGLPVRLSAVPRTVLATLVPRHHDVFAFVVAVLATVQSFTAGGKVFWLFPSGYHDYVMGPILSRNHYAAFIEAVLPIALYEALRRQHSSLLYCAMAAAMYASVIASASRAGTVLATAEIVAVIAIVSIRGGANRRRIGGSLLGICALFALFTAVVGWGDFWSRFWAPDPLQIRRQLVLSTLHMIAAHPWFGVGLGAWAAAYPRYALIDVGLFANQAHNDWLQWTAEGGLPFGLMLVTLFLWCLRPAISSVWGLGVIAVFLHALVDYPFSRPALGAWPILILAMLAAWQSDRTRPGGFPPSAPPRVDPQAAPPD